MRTNFDYDTDHFPYDASTYGCGMGLIKTAVLGLALVGAVLIVAACYPPVPGPPGPQGMQGPAGMRGRDGQPAPTPAQP